MRDSDRGRGQRLVIIGMLLVAMALTAGGYAERGFNYCGLDRLQRSNTAYLGAAIDQSLATFGVLSALKVGLAVVEGSEVGVGFGLQVGDVVQAAYDYVDIAWRVVLAGATVLVSTEYLLKTAQLADQWVLLLTFAGVLAAQLLVWFLPKAERLRRLISRASLFAFSLAIALYLILPLAVAGGAALSRRVTAPVMQEAASGLAALKNDLFPEDKAGSGGYLSAWRDTKERLDQIYSHFKSKAGELVSWILRLMAGYLFDCLVFPLALFMLLLGVTKLSLRHLWDVDDHKISNLIQGGSSSV